MIIDLEKIKTLATLQGVEKVNYTLQGKRATLRVYPKNSVSLKTLRLLHNRIVDIVNSTNVVFVLLGGYYEVTL